MRELMQLALDLFGDGAAAAPPPPASDPVAVLPITLSAMGVVSGGTLVTIGLRRRALRL